MRHVLLLGLITLGVACGDPTDPAAEDAPRDEAMPGPVAPACGDEDALPARATRDGGSLRVVCDGPAGELAVSALAEGIVRIRYGRGAGGSIVPIDRPPPEEPLRAGSRAGRAVVCTRAIEMEIVPGTCAIVAKDVATGTIVLEDGEQGGFFRDGDLVGVTRALAPGEHLYGLGLHTASSAARGLDVRGSIVELYNTDAYDADAGGFRSDASPLYESIPFYSGLRGKAAYGVFTDNTHRMRFDAGATEKDRLRVTAWGGTIDQYLVPGPHLRDVVRRYTRLTGTTPLPPPWALGFHQSRWEGPCDGAPADRPFCSAAQIAAVAQRLRDEKIPADGIFLDIQHMDGLRTFTFDPALFPNPEDLIAELASRGFAVHTIVDPGIKIDPAYSVYATGLSGDHFLKNADGSVFEGEVWPGPSVFPDFSAKKTRAWWSDLVAAHAARGVRGMWIDMNEPASFGEGKTVPDATPADGDDAATTMAEVHNAYAWFEAKATREGMVKARPNERPFVLSRAAFAGQQKYSAVWTGDAPSTWTTLGMTLAQLLHLGLSGMTFAGSDVGGYSGGPESTADLFSRWMALGAVSPFFRAHAEKNARRQEPWAFGEPVLDATRSLVSLRYELLPCLYSAFEEASRTGAPVLRPLVFEFQEDERAQTIADEAMLGPWLLVAPILEPGATSRAVYLPANTPGERWYDLRSGAVYEGGKTITISTAPEPLPRDALPIFAREGAIVPRTTVQDRVFADPAAPLVIDVFPGKGTTTTTLYEDDGTPSPAFSRVMLTAERTATGTRVTASSREGSFVPKHASIRIRVARVDHPVSEARLDGAPATFTWDENDRAAVVTVPSGGPFVLDLTHDPALEADADVAIPITIHLPPGTPSGDVIHVATSTNGWTHVPVARSGDVATGKISAPRGGFVFFKVTRGGWATVEKGSGCIEIENRHAFGTGRDRVEVFVRAWADHCS